MATSNTAFRAWWNEYQRTGSIHPIQLGMTREDLRSFLGEPEASAQGFRQRPLTGIWKFEGIEFHFDENGRLFLVYTEDDRGDSKVIAKVEAG